MQPVVNTCPRCASSIPADAPGGICPACALLGVAEFTDGEQATFGKVPTLEEMAAAFPELELLAMIGHGGMGVVFKARQPRLERLVAVKILPPTLAAQPGFAERFTREARALARLNHPHIVAVYDFGERAGFYYLLMELVNGVNLRQAMQAGVTPEQALGLVPRICEALQFAHDRGVLHRDIKPENVLLDTAGVPKLADFGIAKLAGERGAATGLTATGATLGTAAYMAPEQMEKPSSVDHRADIYSLGVVLYEMLTGELPIGRFPAPSEKSNVARGVDEVVLRALEKERARRQQSATDMKTEVEGLSALGPQEAARAAASAVAAAPALHSPQVLPARNPWPRRLFLSLLLIILLLVALPITYLLIPIAFRPSTTAFSPSASISDIVTPARTPFIGHFSEGTIELMGISHHPSNEKSWWRMDGKELGRAYVNPGAPRSPQLGQRAYEFVFQARDLASGSHLASWQIDGCLVWFSTGSPTLAGKPETRLHDYHLITAIMPTSMQSTVIRLACGAGQWETIFRTASGPGSTSTWQAGQHWKLAFSAPIESNSGETIVTWTASPHPDFETRVVAFTHPGAEIPASARSYAGDQRTWSFPHLPVASIKEFGFQVRRFEWVEFRDVALRPSR